MTDLQTKWIEALRSGKYKQGTGRLRAEDSPGQFEYCCLGVLCDVVNPDKFLPENGVNIHWDELHVGHLLPSSLVRDVELTERTVGSLAYANDNGVSFSEIADVLENYFDSDENLEESYIHQRIRESVKEISRIQFYES